MCRETSLYLNDVCVCPTRRSWTHTAVTEEEHVRNRCPAMVETILTMALYGQVGAMADWVRCDHRTAIPASEVGCHTQDL